MKVQALSAKFHLPFSFDNNECDRRVPLTNEITGQGRQGCSLKTNIKIVFLKMKWPSLNATEWFNKTWSMESEQMIQQKYAAGSATTRLRPKYYRIPVQIARICK